MVAAYFRGPVGDASRPKIPPPSAGMAPGSSIDAVQSMPLGLMGGAADRHYGEAGEGS
jgi:hypothetical protein